jgi:hypothetical protein
MPPYVAKQYAYEQPILAVVVPLTMLSLIVVFIATGDWADYWWVMALSLLVVAALLVARLVIEVTDEHIRVRLAGLYRRDIPLSEVVGVEARGYHALKQFGGWGWRLGRNGDRAYTVKGNDAAVVTLASGHDVYLGARDTQALADAIATRRG